ncbi:MAG: response regulator [Chloroflexi bacterium]|nr:response regulator [Chloroflexota bacterium]
MIEIETHSKRILLVEDLEQFYTPIQRWLNDEGYHVTLASTYQDALDAIDKHHFHLAIVDIRLVDSDPTNEAGMDLLLNIEERQLNKIMPCIVLTAYEDVNNILVATQERQVAKYIQKSTGYRSKLLAGIRELFDEKIKINFELIYDVGSVELVSDVATDVNWSMSVKPELYVLAEQVRDLFGKLFVDAKRVHISKLKPGLTGAAVIRVRPTWDHGLGPAFVAKIGREDKVRTEAERYETYVRRYLPPNTIAQIKDVAYTRHVGALLYTFTENDMIPLREFDEFYYEGSAQEISESLRNLFETTCRWWYDARERKIEDLQQLYYKAFRLERDKLVTRIQVVLPRFDPNAETFRFDHVPIEAINPIAWLNKYRHECVVPTYSCITHGDLTGRNIMVDQNGKCWLIDFYRTYDSHILRDFVILETDIKYRLMQTPLLERFLRMEEGLLSTDDTGEEITISLNMSRDMRKAASVVNLLRSTAYELVAGGFRAKYQESRREYLISLLMTTLNVVRLRHIDEERKFQAMLSAAMICAELDKIAGRKPMRPRLDGDWVVSVETAVSTTAQQRYLSEQLAQNNLHLFLGTDTPSGFSWSDSLQMLVQLSWRAIYTTQKDERLERCCLELNVPFETISETQSQEDNQLNEFLPIYKLPDLHGVSASNERVVISAADMIAQMRQKLQDGHYLLIMCASEKEAKSVYDACYTEDANGQLWIVGGDIPEEIQDDYRAEGWRVLLDTPDELMQALKTLIA